MSFYSLIDESEEQGSDLPWLNEYLELNPKTKDGLFYLVSSVKATKKGYILFTPNFNCFVWRNSKPGTALQTGLNDSTQVDNYPQLAVMIKLKLTNKFVIGFLDDTMSEYQWNAETSVFTIASQKSLPLVDPSNEKK